MQKKNNSEERKKYLRKNRITKVSILVTQITILITFIKLNKKQILFLGTF